MKKIDLLIGFLIGIAASFTGSFLFIELFTEYRFMEGIALMKQEEQIGKIITLGAILNLIAFFVLIKIGKDLMARGVILATIVLAILTIAL